MLSVLIRNVEKSYNFRKNLAILFSILILIGPSCSILLSVPVTTPPFSFHWLICFLFPHLEDFFKILLFNIRFYVHLLFPRLTNHIKILRYRIIHPHTPLTVIKCLAIPRNRNTCRFTLLFSPFFLILISNIPCLSLSPVSFAYSLRSSLSPVHTIYFQSSILKLFGSDTKVTPIRILYCRNSHELIKASLNHIIEQLLVFNQISPSPSHYF